MEHGLSSVNHAVMQKLLLNCPKISLNLIGPGVVKLLGYMCLLI